MFPCHRCKSAEEIPILFTGKKLDFSIYLFRLKISYQNNKSSGDFLQCTSPLKYPSLPKNCALAVYEYDIKPKNDLISCVACESGFAPSFSDQRIVSCDPILNCKRSKVLNSCTECEDGFLLYQNSTNFQVSCIPTQKAHQYILLDDKLVCEFGYISTKFFTHQMEEECIKIGQQSCGALQWDAYDYDMMNESNLLNNFVFFKYNYFLSGCTECVRGLRLIETSRAQCYDLLTPSMVPENCSCLRNLKQCKKCFWNAFLQSNLHCDLLPLPEGCNSIDVN